MVCSVFLKYMMLLFLKSLDIFILRNSSAGGFSKSLYLDFAILIYLLYILPNKGYLELALVLLDTPKPEFNDILVLVLFVALDDCPPFGETMAAQFSVLRDLGSFYSSRCSPLSFFC